LNEFAAIITARSQAKYDLLFFGLYALALALEEPLAVKTFEYQIQIAATWMDQCGELLVANCWTEAEGTSTAENKDDDDDEHSPLSLSPGSLFRGGSKRITLMRWNFWIQRFQSLEHDHAFEYSVEAREAARLALRRMNDITNNIGALTAG
jgi:hypothetical protein